MRGESDGMRSTRCFQRVVVALASVQGRCVVDVRSTNIVIIVLLSYCCLSDIGVSVGESRGLSVCCRVMFGFIVLYSYNRRTVFVVYSCGGRLPGASVKFV